MRRIGRVLGAAALVATGVLAFGPGVEARGYRYRCVVPGVLDADVDGDISGAVPSRVENPGDRFTVSDFFVTVTVPASVTTRVRVESIVARYVIPDGVRIDSVNATGGGTAAIEGSEMVYRHPGGFEVTGGDQVRVGALGAQVTATGPIGTQVGWRPGVVSAFVPLVGQTLTCTPPAGTAPFAVTGIGVDPDVFGEDTVTIERRPRNRVVAGAGPAGAAGAVPGDARFTG